MLLRAKNAAVENEGGLLERQYGFRAGRSTTEVTNEVLTSMKTIQSGRQIILLVTSGVRNAFNSLRWVDVLNALTTKFAVTGNLMTIMQS